MGDLRAGAIEVLRGNDAGRWTKPSASQYPHQWNWDSAFIAIGLACFDWERAAREVESMIEARWRDGMIPHVRYDPDHLADYFPGPDRWPGSAERTATPGVLTSGISNPPILGSAALRVGQRQPDPGARRDFWRRVLPPLAAWLRWFLDSRRLAGTGMPVTVHPWEGGWDNSPRWDHLREAGVRPRRPYRRLDSLHVEAAQRPGDRDYDLYLGLAETLDAAGYRLDRYLEAGPMAVHDVVVDAAWHRAAVDLNRVAEEVGEPPAIAAEEMAAYAAAFEAVHWDGAAKAYFDRDVLTGRPIRKATAATLVAAYSGLVPAGRAEAAWRSYAGASRGGIPVATVPAAAPEHDPLRYWRGPVWVNVNWLVAEGLDASGLGREAEGLRRRTLDLVRDAGFHEYFHPGTGAGLGSDRFSWTAALTLDLLDRA